MEMSLESFRVICDYHGRGGTTSLLLTTVTAEIKGIVSVLTRVREYRSQIPQIAGAHVEGPFISPHKAGAQNSEFICEPKPEVTDQLLVDADVIKRVTLAPEIKGALQAIERFVSSGISVSGGHSDALDEEARAGFDRGMRQVTHTFNCMSSARRRGPYRVAGLLEFAMSEPEILCELIADGKHVAPTLMRMLYQAKGPDGIVLVHPVQNYMLVRGTQAIWVAASAGRSPIKASGGMNCPSGSLCPMLLAVFSATVEVLP